MPLMYSTLITLGLQKSGDLARPVSGQATRGGQLGVVRGAAARYWRAERTPHAGRVDVVVSDPVAIGQLVPDI